MRSVEISAKTRKEAIDRALSELGVELHEVEIEILDEGSRGILGFGKREVRVRVSTDSIPDRSSGRGEQDDDDWKNIMRGRETRPAERQSERPARGGGRQDRSESRDRGPRPDRPADAPREARGGRDDRDRRPARDDRDQRGNRGPREENRDRAPRGENRDRAPRDENRDRAPRDANRDRAPREENRDRPREGRETRGGRDDRPRRDDRGEARGSARDGGPAREARGEGRGEPRNARENRGEQSDARDSGAPREAREGREESRPSRGERGRRGGQERREPRGGERDDRGSRGEGRGQRPEPARRAPMKLRTSGEDELAGDSADFDQDDLAAANAEQPTRRREPEAPEVREARCREAAAILQEVIDRMKITATVTGEVIEDDTLLLKVVSEDSAILIGRKGRTLSALQFIINRMVAAGEAGDLPDRIVVDVEGYLDRRRESLEDMALHLADKAKQTGRNMRVKPLNPQERRIIHLKLQDDPEVRTFSLGESLYRSVIIAPKSGGTDEERPRRSRGGRGGRGGRWRDNAGGPDRDNATSGDSDAADSISAPVETATVDHAEPDES